MYKLFIRRLLFALSRDDAEDAHLIANAWAQIVQHYPGLLQRIERILGDTSSCRPYHVMGMAFPNRVGLAAGFDKNAEVMPFMQALGFGFVEVGSVLPRPQQGNPRPRIFRLEQHSALINRLGFNSAGAAVVEKNLERLRPLMKIPIGISLGKMKDTPLDAAAGDYLAVKKHLYRYGDFFVINVSSPNTPGLRALQGGHCLEALVRTVVDARPGVKGKPVLVKIAPDLTAAELEETVEAAIAGGASGLIVSNTTTARPCGVSMHPAANEQGGLSGPPVFHLMTEKIRQIRTWDPDIPIIGVGGINSLEHGQRALDLGANLIQVGTGLVYEGPLLVQRLRTL